MPRLLALAVLAAVGVGVGCVEPEPCEEQPCGPCVVWHDQADRDLCGALETCGAEAREAAPAALVVFTADPGTVCGWPRPMHGCQHGDLIALEYVGRIGDGAVCHELEHMALWLAGRDLDYGHTGAEWK
jgi:hypothetical protein